MTQNAPKTNATAKTAQTRPVLQRIARALAGGTCVFALSTPLAGQQALARDWEIHRESGPGGTTWTIRKINPKFGGIQHLGKESAPANNCPVLAFEVVNPKPGEIRCVGYVAP